MARVFVQLKLRILRNRLAKSSAIALVGFVLLWLGAFAGGVMVGGLFASAMRFFDDHVGRVLAVGFNTLGLMWVVIPVIAAALDDSLEPRRFELLPLDRNRLAGGLLIAGLIGPGALGTVLLLGFGLARGIGDLATAIPLLLIAVLATVVMVATARWLTAVLSDLLRRRRSQEIVALVLGLFLALPGLISAALVEREGELGLEGASRFGMILDGLSWTPFGSFAAGAAALTDGRWMGTLAWLAYGLAFLALMVWAFGRALDRLQTRTVAAGPKAVSDDLSLMPRWLPLPDGAIGGVAAKELVYLRRDPRVRAQLMGGAIAVIVISFTGGVALLETPYGPFLAAFAVFMVVASVIPNQFGFDGGSFWGYVTSVGRMGDVVRGKNLGWALIALPLALVVAVTIAGLSGEWAYVPASLFGSTGVLLVWMAIGNISSILGGFRLPESNMFGNRNMSGNAFVYSFLGIIGSGVLTLPLAAATAIPALIWGPPAATLGALVGAGYAVLLYRIGLSWADRTLASKALKLLEAIDKDR